MSLKKQFLKSRPVCKVTFTVPADRLQGGKEVSVLGDFNDWDPEGYRMRKLKDGSFTKTVELDCDREYQFRYLVDGTTWINDDEPDGLVYSGVAAEQNGIVKV